MPGLFVRHSAFNPFNFRRFDSPQSNKPRGRMNARDDDNYYRGLLESAQKGIENAKAF